MIKPKVIILTLLLLTAAVPIYNANADTFLWGGYVYSTEGSVTSITSTMGQVYRIVASEVFEYNDPLNLAADAMYYTTGTNTWNWINHYALPDGHSFLQINGADIKWGPFSNGDTYHTYTIHYVGDGSPIVFNIIDWIDGDKINNHCHFRVMIYAEETRWGFTPGFWKQPQHFDSWPMEYATDDSLQDVFGPGAPDVTLPNALSLPGGKGVEGAKGILARAATAALLNSLALEDWYNYSAEEVIELATEQFAHGTRASILSLAADFDYWNNIEPPFEI